MCRIAGIQIASIALCFAVASLRCASCEHLCFALAARSGSNWEEEGAACTTWVRCLQTVVLCTHSSYTAPLYNTCVCFTYMGIQSMNDHCVFLNIQLLELTDQSSSVYVNTEWPIWFLPFLLLNFPTGNLLWISFWCLFTPKLNHQNETTLNPEFINHIGIHLSSRLQRQQ